jgi:hypothetical protein
MSGHGNVCFAVFITLRGVNLDFPYPSNVVLTCPGLIRQGMSRKTNSTSHHGDLATESVVAL